jgi:hypothetical protein
VPGSARASAGLPALAPHWVRGPLPSRAQPRPNGHRSRVAASSSPRSEARAGQEETRRRPPGRRRTLTRLRQCRMMGWPSLGAFNLLQVAVGRRPKLLGPSSAGRSVPYLHPVDRSQRQRSRHAMSRQRTAAGPGAPWCAGGDSSRCVFSKAVRQRSRSCRKSSSRRSLARMMARNSSTRMSVAASAGA